MARTVIPSPGQSMTAAVIEDALLDTGHMANPDRARVIEIRLREAGLLDDGPRRSVQNTIN